MPTIKMYEGRAVTFDFNDYPDGLENPIAQKDFITEAIEECHYCLPDDWYVEGYYGGTAQDGDNRTIVVCLKRYEPCLNLQPRWNFKLTADPVEDDGTQWIVYDVVRWEPSKLYSFQMP
jgi:hypothetical protein